MTPVGFTGTRDAPSAAQATGLKAWMQAFGRAKLHHGGCVGADSMAHVLAKIYGWRVVLHPGLGLDHLKGRCDNPDEVREAKRHLDRNTDIVQETSLLLIVPRGPEELRSGTWSTYRKAKALHRPRIVFMPNGDVVREDAEVLGWV